MYISLKDSLTGISKIFYNNLVINSVLVGIFLEFVECKHCTYSHEYGRVKNFFCNAYEYCCGPLCCRSRSIGFFQLWYFWLMIILMLMLCSGGGWWYKFRYRHHYRQGLHTFGVANNTTGFRPSAYTPGQPSPAPYLSGMTTAYPPNAGFYPPNIAGVPVYMPPNSVSGTYPTGCAAYPTQPMGAMPPPPYSGPPPPYTTPPSYATATRENTS